MSGVGSRESGDGSGASDTGPRPDWDELILIGVVARTQGNKGHVIVNAHTDFAEERFRPGVRFEARLTDGEQRAVEVNSVRFFKGRPIIGMAGVETIDEAERYAGAELRMAEAELGELPEGCFYHHQLVGCEVVGEDGEPVGRVVAVEGEMARSRLVVAGAQRRHEIPLADDICTVDVAARRIVIRPPEGLLDL